MIYHECDDVYAVASIYRELLTTVEANYPESLRTCYVVNGASFRLIVKQGFIRKQFVE